MALPLDRIAFGIFCEDRMYDEGKAAGEFVNNVPRWLGMWNSMLDSLETDPHWKDGKHSGDCTKECHSCLRCEVEGFYRDAERILNIVPGMCVDCGGNGGDSDQKCPRCQGSGEDTDDLRSIVDVDHGKTIEDGFGSAWGGRCLECGRLSMQVVRPGKVQCGWCG
jgi:hypothetical protein